MFGVNLECAIKSVKVRVQDVGGRPLRRCGMVLVHEFTRDIARTLGPDAVATLAGLRSGAIEKCVMPIDKLAALGVLQAGGETIQIERMAGVKATCLPAKAEDAGPR